MSELIDRQALLSKRGEFSYCEVCPVWSLIKDAPTVAASPWHRVEEPPKEDGWYILGFLSRWKGGNWWIPKFPDYWMTAEPPKEDA